MVWPHRVGYAIVGRGRTDLLGGGTVAGDGCIVPISASRTLRETVEYAVQVAFESSEHPRIRFVYIHAAQFSADTASTARLQEATQLLDRVTVWASEDAGERDLTIETAHLGTDAYVFSPEDVADVIAADARAHDIDRVILDPEYEPGIGAPLVRPLSFELEQVDLSVSEAPADPKTVRMPLLERTSLAQMGGLFLISFVFYQILGGNFDWVFASPADWVSEIYWFDIITGVVAGTVVAVSLSRVTFSDDPTRTTLARIVRHTIYIPYLLMEIIKANIVVAFVILHPRLPIDPRMARIEPAVWGGLPVTTLANSITLTPGTLTVRVEGRTLAVHTLLPAAREDLFDGGLERAVRFVFYGREAMRMPSLTERGEAELIEGEEIFAGTLTATRASERETDDASNRETVAEADLAKNGETEGDADSANNSESEGDEQ